jgi:hypothetical protein
METDVKKPRTLRRVKRSAHTTATGNTVAPTHFTNFKFLEQCRYMSIADKLSLSLRSPQTSFHAPFSQTSRSISPWTSPSSPLASTSVLQTTKLFPPTHRNHTLTCLSRAIHKHDSTWLPRSRYINTGRPILREHTIGLPGCVGCDLTCLAILQVSIYQTKVVRAEGHIALLLVGLRQLTPDIGCHSMRVTVIFRTYTASWSSGEIHISTWKCILE